MASARKKAAETKGKADVVVEVLDTRLPGASSDPLIERLRRDKQRPCLKILNKSYLPTRKPPPSGCAITASLETTCDGTTDRMSEWNYAVFFRRYAAAERKTRQKEEVE